MKYKILWKLRINNSKKNKEIIWIIWIILLFVKEKK